jgi:phenylalanyl-tRNA synthetase beta chain
MIISYKLLKDSFGCDYTPQELSDKLTSIGIEVEGIREIKHNFKHIITGRIERIELILDTKLFKSIINTGKEKLQIITAATNIKTGDIVPIALPGSSLADGTVIKKKDFKSFKSDGMLCSYLELGLDSEYLSNEEKAGILILPKDTPVGFEFKDILPIDDTILDLSLLPDRADAFSVNGLARWIEILKARDERRGADLSKFIPQINIDFEKKTKFGIEIKNPQLCSFYSGRIIRRVNIKQSSLNLRQKLFMLKVRPINNIVDTTNFVTKFYGQPLHAFDFDKLDRKVIIRLAKKGEKLKTLDEVERNLTDNNLVIADSKKPIAIAGVMGGYETSVTNNTKNIFLESAHFSPLAVAKSSRTIGLITDASTLFEKGVDNRFPPIASLVATDLICKETNGIPYRDNIVSYVKKADAVNVRFDRINLLLGKEIDKEEVKNYFQFEGLKYKDRGSYLEVTYPSFRQDIKIEEDLIEEIIRMKGYNEFKESLPHGEFRGSKRTDFENFIWFLKDKLIQFGLTEIQTFSLINLDKLRHVGFNDKKRVIKILNPLTEDMNILRPILLPTIIEVVERNKNANQENISLFELGKIFRTGSQFEELTELGIILSGDRIDKNAFKKSFKYDFFYLKGIIEELLFAVKAKYNFKEARIPFMHPFQGAKIIISNKEIGYLGKLRDEISKNTFYASIIIEPLFNGSYNTINFEDFSIYPPVKRDIAVVVDQGLPEKTVREVFINLNIKELKKITLFDVYSGTPLPEGKKNLAYSLEFSSMDKTLKGEEIDKIIEKIEKKVKKKVNGILRTQ